MIATAQTDRALANLFTTWFRCQSPIQKHKAIAVFQLGTTLCKIRGQALNLPEYNQALEGARCHWAIRQEGCYLVLLIRFIDRPLPDGLRDLKLLEAIGAIVFCHLGVSQTELVGDDWKGLRVMRNDSGWTWELL